jgi:hypothetical protein
MRKRLQSAKVSQSWDRGEWVNEEEMKAFCKRCGII